MKKEVQEEPVITYTVRGRNFPNVWVFEYTLEGVLKRFTIEEGVFSEKQIQWLFNPHRFPYKENTIKSWIDGIKNIEVIVGEPDLSFENFYNLYGYKIKPTPAKKAWQRTSKSNKLLAIKGIKPYKAYLKRKGIAQAYPATYLNQEQYLSQYNSY